MGATAAQINVSTWLLRCQSEVCVLFKAAFLRLSAFMYSEGDRSWGERGVLMVRGSFGIFYRRAGMTGRVGGKGGGAGGGSAKRELIGSTRILMFTAACGRLHLAHIWY